LLVNNDPFVPELLELLLHSDVLHEGLLLCNEYVLLLCLVVAGHLGEYLHDLLPVLGLNMLVLLKLLLPPEHLLQLVLQLLVPETHLQLLDDLALERVVDVHLVRGGGLPVLFEFVELLGEDPVLQVQLVLHRGEAADGVLELLVELVDLVVLVHDLLVHP
jgi:hypothetical protein